MSPHAIFLVCLMFPVTLVQAATVTRYSLNVDKGLKVLVTVKGASEDASGSIDLVDAASGQVLVHQDVSPMRPIIENGKVKAVLGGYPAGADEGDPGALMYEDFNFDGLKDLALVDGDDAAYGSNSYSIYLARPGSPARFDYSEPFSRLAHGALGMFAVDRGSRQLLVRSKSGCCYHRTDAYSVVDGLPRPLQSVAESASCAPLVQVTDYRWEAGRNTAQTGWRYEGQDEPQDPLFSFAIRGSGKRMVLCEFEGAVHYFFVNGKGKVELHYPDEATRGAFVYRSQGDAATLVFQQGGAVYTIYREAGGTGAGIRVSTPQKVVDLRAQTATITGDLQRLDPTLSNVSVSSSGQ